jgi:hypothetical protein
MSSETIPIDGMQWTDSPHRAEHEKILPLNVPTVWVQSMWKLCSKQFNAKRNWRNFQSHVYVLGDNFYCWDAVDRLEPSRRTWENTAAKRSEGLGPIHAKTVFQAVPRKMKLTQFQSHVYVLEDNSYWWDAVNRLAPSRRTWENTSPKRSEGLGPIHVKTVFQAVQRKMKLTEFSESCICPRRQSLSLECSAPTWPIPNMRI